MNTSIFFPAARFALLSGLLLLASGCAVIGSHQETKFTGTQVSATTLDKVRPGVTTEAWLRATLGEPSGTEVVDDSTRIMRYTSKEITRIETALLLVLDTSSRKETIRTVYFEIHDGVLDRYWTEGDEVHRRG